MIKLLFLLILSTFSLAIPSFEARAQVVNDTVFCLNISGDQCRRPIRDGGVVRLSDLNRVGGEPAIYFWGSIRTNKDVVTIIAFERSGFCYSNENEFGEHSTRDLNFVDEIDAFVDGFTVGGFFNSLGIPEIGISDGSIKFNPVSIEPSDRYRVHDFRYAACAGVFRARLLDSQGNPYAGNNPIRTITVR